jgi:hypothetical protein
MSESGESGYMIAGCIALILIIGVAALIGWLVYRTSPYLFAGAAIYGAGIALWNYGLAFVNNVKPRRSAP